MDIIFVPLFKVILFILGLYTWAVFLSVILNWLTAFNIVNAYNRFVFLLSAFLFKITEPPLRFIRRFLPTLGGFDLSPMVLILALWFLHGVIERVMYKLT